MPARRSPTDRPDAGFTILEVLIALAVVAVVIVAIGSVMSTNARGVQALENHVALAQTAQMVMATALPPRKELAPGVLSGEVRGFRWQVDIGPLDGDAAGNDSNVAWVPELVKIRVRSPSGAAVELQTIRLMRRPQR
ncbi:prepilin-type N-terminal cleavage/methylation domain-containing protein [Afipia sp. GAS231]|uniref:prepilin-type N-terminal cleavage/methylation domain-containing protein n=1 Tax=Afipia sp. GAS231 TaxID=1882747 RepID=UPI000B8833D0|nr:prepilin-type N-terminal cleavage/methylation domain-containing protein [Afipia sp. GAS231]